jgi:MoaA/NifB/PqqE/SkfB family radical SAM enzyme
MQLSAIYNCLVRVRAENESDLMARRPVACRLFRPMVERPLIAILSPHLGRQTAARTCGVSQCGDRPARAAALVKISEMVDRWIPAVCDVSVTNACNATCDFCSYAHDMGIVRDRRWINPAEFARALPTLRRRGMRYLNFQVGEPLLHRGIDQLIADAANAGMRPAPITNGWLLPQKMRRLAAAGLGTLLVSIDSHSMRDHERNRGVRGLKKRIQSGLGIARQHGVSTVASITMSRPVDYESLPEVLVDLGFDFATFLYPRRKPLGSSSLVYSKDSALVDLDSKELHIGFESIKRLKKRFPILNPSDFLTDMQRHVRAEVEMFGCVGGRKYFYLDWNLDIWRCEAWSEPMGSVFDLDRLQNYHDRCTKCMMSCYHDASVLMHAGWPPLMLPPWRPMVMLEPPCRRSSTSRFGAEETRKRRSRVRT